MLNQPLGSNTGDAAELKPVFTLAGPYWNHGNETHLTSTSPPTCITKEPSGCFTEYRKSRSFSLVGARGVPQLSRLWDQCSIWKSWWSAESRAGALKPVYDIVGLLCAQDAQGVYSSICRGQVSVLSRTSSKAAHRALTPGQELTHTGSREQNRLNIYQSNSSQIK